jgi:thioredoxin 1
LRAAQLVALYQKYASPIPAPTAAAEARRGYGAGAAAAATSSQPHAAAAFPRYVNGKYVKPPTASDFLFGLKPWQAGLVAVLAAGLLMRRGREGGPSPTGEADPLGARGYATYYSAADHLAGSVLDARRHEQLLGAIEYHGEMCWIHPLLLFSSDRAPHTPPRPHGSSERISYSLALALVLPRLRARTRTCNHSHAHSHTLTLACSHGCTGDVTNLPVVVDFYSASCGPCRQIAPLFNKMAEDFAGKAVFIKVDSQRLQRSAMMLNVRSLPTFIFFHKTSPVHTFTGADAGQLLKTVQTLAAAAEAEGTHASPEEYPSLEEVRAAVHRGTPRPADDRGDAPSARDAAITAKAEEYHAK